MASSDSQIDKPQRGRPKRDQLPDVNINTDAQSINIEKASLKLCSHTQQPTVELRFTAVEKRHTVSNNKKHRSDLIRNEWCARARFKAVCLFLCPSPQKPKATPPPPDWSSEPGKVQFLKDDTFDDFVKENPSVLVFFFTPSEFSA